MTDPTILLIRYDEIGLKGKNRKFFERCLLDNMRRALRGVEGLRFEMPHGRILVRIPAGRAEECVRQLGFVPGIASISAGFEVEPDFDVMASLGIKLIETHLRSNAGLKFCVRAQRSNKTFPSTSPEINFEVGSRIMQVLSERGLSVDINNADYRLEVEVGVGHTLVFDNRIAGLSGLPVGSAGRVLNLLSGGIDSPVSGFMMMRRGCRAHSIFFDNQTFLGRGGYDKVVRLATILNRYQGAGRLYVVPFQDVQVAIRDRCRSENRIVLYRRMMYRIASIVAENSKCLGLVTGESLGQVASQTLENLAAVSCVVPGSVFRPLIGMDKKQIIKEAQRIGTYETSIEAQPDCCSVFMPDRPVTRSKIKILEQDEASYPWEDLMREALAKMEVIELDDLE